jgi:hypothetical protein
MTSNEKYNELKSELLTTTIKIVKRWVTFNLVFTDKVKVKIENTGNDTVDDVSLVFSKPFELRPGADTVFLTLHYKDADTTKSGDNFRFHYPNYGIFTEWMTDDWVKTLSCEESGKGLFVAHHALIQLVKVLENIKEFCDKGNYHHFDPSSSSFPFDLIVGDDKFNELF